MPVPSIPLISACIASLPPDDHWRFRLLAKRYELARGEEDVSVMADDLAGLRALYETRNPNFGGLAAVLPDREAEVAALKAKLHAQEASGQRTAVTLQMYSLQGQFAHGFFV